MLSKKTAEKMVREFGEGIAEKTAKEIREETVEKVEREFGEGIAEKTAREIGGESYRKSLS